MQFSYAAISGRFIFDSINIRLWTLFSLNFLRTIWVGRLQSSLNVTPCSLVERQMFQGNLLSLSGQNKTLLPWGWRQQFPPKYWQLYTRFQVSRRRKKKLITQYIPKGRRDQGRPMKKLTDSEVGTGQHWSTSSTAIWWWSEKYD
jgi:hypothetical protein